MLSAEIVARFRSCWPFCSIRWHIFVLHLNNYLSLSFSFSLFLSHTHSHSFSLFSTISVLLHTFSHSQTNTYSRTLSLSLLSSNILSLFSPSFITTSHFLSITCRFYSFIVNKINSTSVQLIPSSHKLENPINTSHCMKTISFDALTRTKIERHLS